MRRLTLRALVVGFSQKKEPAFSGLKEFTGRRQKQIYQGQTVNPESWMCIVNRIVKLNRSLTDNSISVGLALRLLYFD